MDHAACCAWTIWNHTYPVSIRLEKSPYQNGSRLYLGRYLMSKNLAFGSPTVEMCNNWPAYDSMSFLTQPRNSVTLRYIPTILETVEVANLMTQTCT